MKVRRYETPSAFKDALEQQLRAHSADGERLAQERQLVVFHRFLARVEKEFGPNATLKGGLALELRVHRARTTRDVDLRVTGSPNELLVRLRKAGALDLDDFLSFAVSAAPQPLIQNKGMHYEGRRFRAEARLAGRIYGRAFGIDAAFGEPLHGKVDTLLAEDVLGFAGVPPATVRLYPRTTHLAEKLHAYTMPRARPNSRVKDLPDLVLLARAGPLTAIELQAAFAETFDHRKTHPLPSALPEPPSSWSGPYLDLVRENRLPWPKLAAVFQAAAAFLDPMLSGARVELWEPQTWSWS